MFTLIKRFYSKSGWFFYSRGWHSLVSLSDRPKAIYMNVSCTRPVGRVLNWRSTIGEIQMLGKHISIRMTTFYKITGMTTFLPNFPKSCGDMCLPGLALATPLPVGLRTYLAISCFRSHVTCHLCKIDYSKIVFKGLSSIHSIPWHKKFS